MGIERHLTSNIKLARDIAKYAQENKIQLDEIEALYDTVVNK